jgi:Uma2 family endonuclease
MSPVATAQPAEINDSLQTAKIVSPTGHSSRRGEWTWELAALYPRQGDWPEELYLVREFDGMVEYSDGVLDFLCPLYPPEEGGPPSSQRGDWTWELVADFPRQGEWTERDYFALDETKFVELKDGCLEFLPMPSRMHQLLTRYLFRLLDAFVESRKLGEVHFTGLNVRLEPEQVRFPDLCYLSPERLGDPQGVQDLADLMVDVTSPGSADRKRDLVEKRADYARCGVPEYWIVDPETETITVLTLPAGKTEYAAHGEFQPGQQATSVLLPGFAVDVAACFAAGKGDR